MWRTDDIVAEVSDDKGRDQESNCTIEHCLTISTPAYRQHVQSMEELK